MSECGWPVRKAPTLNLLFSICKNIHLWLRTSPKNTAVIHCTVRGVLHILPERKSYLTIWKCNLHTCCLLGSQSCKSCCYKIVVSDSLLLPIAVINLSPLPPLSKLLLVLTGFCFYIYHSITLVSTNINIKNFLVYVCPWLSVVAVCSRTGRLYQPLYWPHSCVTADCSITPPQQFTCSPLGGRSPRLQPRRKGTMVDCVYWYIVRWPRPCTFQVVRFTSREVIRQL